MDLVRFMLRHKPMIGNRSDLDLEVFIRAGLGLAKPSLA